MDLLKTTAVPPAEIDLKTAQQMTFISKDKSTIEPVALVLYDDSNYTDVYTGDEILKLVAKRKLEGIIIPGEKLKDMVLMLLDAYPVLMLQDARLEDKLKVANRISSFLTDIRVM